MKLGDDGSNILKDYNHQIPSWWGSNSPNSGKKTRTELLEARKKERLPDISFDLDGDGFVGGRDYVISKIYDKDGDGKLNQEERKAADEAVLNVSKVICTKALIRVLKRSSFGMLNKRERSVPSESFSDEGCSSTLKTSSQLHKLTRSTRYQKKCPTSKYSKSYSNNDGPITAKT